MNVLVTGAAGFIGMHVALRLLERGDRVLGIDNLNDYYDPQLKRDRLAQLAPFDGFRFEPVDIADDEAMDALFARESFDRVVHLAAQAGVRYSLTHPRSYARSNLTGFLNVLEGCRHQQTPHLVYASSSSVYGGNQRMPYRERDGVDHPVSLYAATKRANELMAHTYSHLYALPTTGLRFFTVYGPWGRPDMAPALFTSAIAEGRPIRLFNHGQMQRDFTYIDDIVQGVLDVTDRIAQPQADFDPMHPDPSRGKAPFQVLNIGNHEPVPLMDFVAALENALGRVAEKQMLPMQPGDVQATFADIDALHALTGFRPGTPVSEGVQRYVDWYREYHGLPAVAPAA